MSSGLTRRQMLKRGAVFGGALVWAVPLVQAVGINASVAQAASGPLGSTTGTLTIDPGLVEQLCEIPEPGSRDIELFICRSADFTCVGTIYVMVGETPNTSFPGNAFEGNVCNDTGITIYFNTGIVEKADSGELSINLRCGTTPESAVVVSNTVIVPACPVAP